MAIYNTLLGKIEIISSGEKITEIMFSCKESISGSGRDKFTDQAAKELEEYFCGKRQKFEFPIHYDGTPFQKKVWKAVLEIPYGEKVNYADIAKKVGNPAAVRAVGTAIGKNRLLIVIPCHRVIRKDGTMGGYEAGVELKKKLLAIENKVI